MSKRELDPRVVGALFIGAFLVATAVYDVLWGAVLGIMPLFLLLWYKRIPIQRFLQPVSGSLGFLMIVLFLVNLWYYPKTYEVYHPEYSFWLIRGVYLITLDGVAYALQATMRFMLILLMMVSLTLVIPIADLVDLLYRVKMPKQLILALSIGLSYVPVLTKELLTIREAQEARAWRVRTWNPIKKAANWAPLLVPAVKAATRHGGLLAVAVECRGFTLATKRVSRKKFTMGAADVGFAALVGVAVVVALVFGNWGVNVAHWRFTADLLAQLLDRVVG